MITYRELVTALRALGLERTTPLLVHASLDTFEPVNGGVDSLLGALLSAFDTLLAPVFTFRTTLIPEVGPEDNGLVYGSGRMSNAMAEFYRPDMPADRAMGLLAESLRHLPQARRSGHPILSFAGVNAGEFLEVQTLAQPLAPLEALQQAGGWVLLLGVDHTANTSLHAVEAQAGRQGFVRWALTPAGVVECPHMPGCTRGFNAAETRLRRMTRQVQVGKTFFKAVPLLDQAEIILTWLQADPNALLCERADCLLCQTVRPQVVRV
jgi:aminoglycoside 3-N-acetyltransferase